MIHWITGEINQGKSTRLVKIFRSLAKGDGFYNRKVYHHGTYVGQEIVHLATGESRLFSVQKKLVPANWQEECCYDVYSFSREGLDFGRNILKAAYASQNTPLFIDEIGPLELQGQGFADIFAELVSKRVEMYVVVRSSCLDSVMRKFGLRS